jgi:hypothetical protein
MFLKKSNVLIVISILTILIFTSSIYAASDCNEQIVSSKVFDARSETIYLGLVCSDNAKINTYLCEDDYSCLNKDFLKQVYKVNGVLSKVDSFSVGEYYYYDCLECLQNSPAELSIEETDIVVNEGDRIDINAECTDPDGDKTTTDYSGWMTLKTKFTNRNDAGKYTVTVKCLDNNGEGESKKVNVEVLENNSPPIIVWITRILE